MILVLHKGTHYFSFLKPFCGSEGDVCGLNPDIHKFEILWPILCGFVFGSTLFFTSSSLHYWCYQVPFQRNSSWFEAQENWLICYC